MDNSGLIFIPDISGFTSFVNNTEIEHSRFIIEELLETIINSNQLGLNISEIEGDAVLFYKFGDPPKVQERLFTACLEHQPPWWCKKYCSSHLQSLLQNLLSEIVKIYIMLFMGLFSEWTQKKQEARIHVLAFHSFDLKTIV
ncbi:MAG TPA: DUF2652 domain-containing protein, partial [Flavitalea sp.]|nr:DUF2652 domain-containing protein [Flavitalea sp.]